MKNCACCKAHKAARRHQINRQMIILNWAVVDIF